MHHSIGFPWKRYFISRLAQIGKFQNVKWNVTNIHLSVIFLLISQTVINTRSSRQGGQGSSTCVCEHTCACVSTCVSTRAARQGHITCRSNEGTRQGHRREILGVCPSVGHRSQPPRGRGLFRSGEPRGMHACKTGPEHTAVQHKLWWFLFLGRNWLLAKRDST